MKLSSNAGTGTYTLQQFTTSWTETLDGMLMWIYFNIFQEQIYFMVFYGIWYFMDVYSMHQRYHLKSETISKINCFGSFDRRLLCK